MKITKNIKRKLYASLGQQLKKIRQEKGWKLEDAAEATGLKPNKPEQMENGSDRWMWYHLSNLMMLIACYDKIIKIEFVNPPEVPETGQPAEFMLDKICS